MQDCSAGARAPEGVRAGAALHRIEAGKDGHREAADVRQQMRRIRHDCQTAPSHEHLSAADPAETPCRPCWGAPAALHAQVKVHRQPGAGVSGAPVGYDAPNHLHDHEAHCQD